MKKAENFLRFLVRQIPLLLCAIQTTHGTVGPTKIGMACDNLTRNTLNCENDGIICITSITVGQNSLFRCGRVKNNKPNENCTEDLVKSFVQNKCNGVVGSCNMFYRDTEISPYCKRAFKYVEILFVCVSSPSECSAIPAPTTPTTTKASTTTKGSTTERFTSLKNVMALMRIVSSTTSFATSTPRTSSSPKSVENQTSTSTSPAHSSLTNEQKTKNDTSTDSPLPSPVPPSHVLGIKMCTRIIRPSVATVSSIATPRSTEPATTPPGVGRSTGHSFFNHCVIRKLYSTVILVAFIVTGLS